MKPHLNLVLLLAACSHECAEPAPEAQPPPPSAVHGVLVPAGSFTMGSPKDEPCRAPDETEHAAVVHVPFAVDPNEVTQKAFEARMGYNPSFHAKCPDCPVERVSWHEAAAYCNALSAAHGLPACYACAGEREGTECAPLPDPPCLGHRLPTETEWEYAARAGGAQSLPTGDVVECMSGDRVVDTHAWYKANSDGYTHPVGGKEPNAWGLFDMAGNVYEWTATEAGSDHDASPPLGSGDDRIVRGGSWYHNAGHARHAQRLRVRSTNRLSYVGFRCVHTVWPAEAP